MKSFITLFLFFVVSVCFAQNKKINVANTFFVYSNKEFRIPKDSVTFIRNIIYIDITTTRSYNKKIDILSNKLKTNEFPIGKRVRNSSFYCYLYDILFEEGAYDYCIESYYEYRNEEGGQIYHGWKEDHYPVKVLLPTIACPDTLRSTYYLGEKLQFSFATVEYDNVNNYSYSVFINNNKIDSTKGTPFVNLDTFLCDPENRESIVTIKGYYNGKAFKYKLTDGKVKSSTWEFAIKEPYLDNDSFWHRSEQNVTPLVCASNPKSTIFYFTYLSEANNQTAIAIKPVIRNLQWSGNIIGNAGVISDASSVYTIIFVEYNMNIIPIFSSVNDIPETTIKFEFDTQFGHKTFSWRAKVFQVQ